MEHQLQRLRWAAAQPTPSHAPPSTATPAGQGTSPPSKARAAPPTRQGVLRVLQTKLFHRCATSWREQPGFMQKHEQVAQRRTHTRMPAAPKSRPKNNGQHKVDGSTDALMFLQGAIQSHCVGVNSIRQNRLTGDNAIQVYRQIAENGSTPVSIYPRRRTS